ncbi:hypothetical protein [Cellulomonas soli]
MTTPTEGRYAEQFVEFHSFELLGARLISSFDNSVLREHLTEPDEMVSIRTGIHTGWVLVAVERLGSPPTEPVAQEWQTVVEASIEPLETTAVVGSATSGPNRLLPELRAPERGFLRLRVSARNRDEHYDGAGGDPLEFYLVQAWPGGSPDGIVVRDSGRASAELQGPSVVDAAAPPSMWSSGITR